MNEEHIWVVRVPKGQDIIQQAHRGGYVAIGFAIQQSIAEINDILPK